jgi:hypothetical protein
VSLDREQAPDIVLPYSTTTDGRSPAFGMHRDCGRYGSHPLVLASLEPFEDPVDFAGFLQQWLGAII